MKVKRMKFREMSRKQRRILFLGVSFVYLLLSFGIIAHLEQVRIYDTIERHMAALKKTCQKYDDYRLGNETEDLQDIIDRTRVLSDYAATSNLKSDEAMKDYARSVNLSGVIVLDEALNTVSNVDVSGNDNSAFLSDVVNDDNAESILKHSNKVFAHHLKIGTEKYTYAMVARCDEPGLIVCYNSRSLLQTDKYELSMNTLLNLEGLEDGEIVTVADGVTILATNAKMLQGLSVEDCPVPLIDLSDDMKENQKLLRMHTMGKTWYGMHDTYRNYYHFYISFPMQVPLTHSIQRTLLAFGIYLMLAVLAMGVWQQIEHRKLLAIEKQYYLVRAIGSIYTVGLMIHIKQDRWEAVIEETPMMRDIIGNISSAREMLKRFNERAVKESDRQFFENFVDLDTANERLKNKSFDGFSFEDTHGRWHQGIVIPRCDPKDGQVTDVMLLLRNVSDQKKKEMNYQEQLRKTAEEAALASASKTDFLRRMSHDIRTPINGIRGMAEIGKSCPGDARQTRECFEKILSVSGFLLELVNNVLDMSKLDADEVQFDETAFDIRDVLEKTLTVIEFQAAERKIHLQVDPPEGEHWHLRGSPLNLQRVLQNIIANAVKYNRPGGSVRVSLKERDVRDGKAIFEFVCADTGIGMTPEFQLRAFDLFAQENGGVHSRYAGTGLGLPIAKRTVEYMGGSIRFISEKDKGTVFTVKLPILIDGSFQEAPEEPECAGGASESVEGVKVLLVEDNPLNREIAEYMLAEKGALVTIAEDGQQALDVFASSPENAFDVILMDIQMPRMDGYEATRQIRNLNRSDAKIIPIFAMTANTFKDDVAMSRSAGMNEHIAKPLDYAKLARMICRYLKK